MNQSTPMMQDEKERTNSSTSNNSNKRQRSSSSTFEIKSDNDDIIVPVWINPIADLYESYITQEISKLKSIFNAKQHDGTYSFTSDLYWDRIVYSIDIQEYLDRSKIPLNVFFKKIVPQLCELGILSIGQNAVLDITLYKGKKLLDTLKPNISKQSNIKSTERYITLLDMMKSNAKSGEILIENEIFKGFIQQIIGSEEDKIKHFTVLFKALGLILEQTPTAFVISWKLFNL